MNRRNFLKVAATSSVLGSLGMAEEVKSEKSVIFIFLSGGISHYEFSSPNPNSAEAYRSVTGFSDTNVNGIQIGGNYKKLATIADKFSIVRGFSHNDAGHGGGSHEILTGMVRVDRTNDTATPDFPSMGSVVSSYFGSTLNGMPSYVGTGRVYADGPAWLGPNFGAYENSGEAINNLKIKVEQARYNSRKELNSLLPDFNLVTRNGNSKALDNFQEQSYTMLEGGIQNKFNIELESEETRLKYGKTNIGNQLLLARRLVENGSKFILSVFGGWDFHEAIKEGHDRLDPETDKAIYALISDLYERGLDKNTLVIISTEFGRTKLNSNQKVGRDHHPGVVPLIFAGGGYNHGRIIGEHDKNGLYTISGKVSPKDVNATLFSFLGIPDRLQAIDHQGRPRDLLPPNSKTIL